MEAEEVFAAFETDLHLRKKTESALRTYRKAAKEFTGYLRSEHLSLEEIRQLDIQRYFAQRGLNPASQRTELKYIRAAWNYARTDLSGIERPFPRVRLEDVPTREPHTISGETLRAIKAGIETKEDWALFHLLAYTGARRFEIAPIRWDDISFGDQSLRVRWGKGRKERRIPLHPELAKALRGLGVYYKPSPYVFPGRKGGPITVNTLSIRLKALNKSGTHVAPHDFRRTVASSLENNEAREAAIYQIMGWSPDGSLRLRNYTSISMRRLYLEILKLYSDDPI